MTTSPDNGDEAGPPNAPSNAPPMALPSGNPGDEIVIRAPKHISTRPSWNGPAMLRTTQESVTTVKASPAREIIIPSQNLRNSLRRATWT